MKKDALLLAGLLGLIVLFIVFGGIRSLFPQSAELLKTKVQIGENSFDVEVAKTSPDRAKGLSGRQSLSPGEGMLFVFDRDDRFSFWMKNTLIPLDLVWIDKDKKVADITHNAEPGAGIPDSQLRIYKPATPVRYVLEVLGGQARVRDIKIGQAVEFTVP